MLGQDDRRADSACLCLSLPAGWGIISRLGVDYKVKTWRNTGTLDGVSHAAGTLMRTWQVIQETGLHTYNIMANPKYVNGCTAVCGCVLADLRACLPACDPRYRPAIRALQEEVAKQAKGGKGGQSRIAKQMAKAQAKLR